MRSQQRWVLIAVGSSLCCLLGSSRAAAYCQTTTSEQQVSSCSDSCVTDGYPLAWPRSNITYVFNEKGFPALSDSQVRSVFDDAFGTWEAVRCDGEPVGLTLSAAAGTTALTVGPERKEPNESVIAHLTRDEWADLGLDGRAFALTAIWFDGNSGRILGADMHFNGGMDPFVVCPADGCGPGVTDLPNVATHEAGHFLGLAHSQASDSTMWCDAQGDETSKRSLSSDDERGLCAVYPPGVAYTPDYFPEPVATRGSKGSDTMCSAGPVRPGVASGGWVTLLAGLALVLRRRSR